MLKLMFHGTHLRYLYGKITGEKENEGYKGVVVGIHPKRVRNCKASHPKKDVIQIVHEKICAFPHLQ